MPEFSEIFSCENKQCGHLHDASYKESSNDQDQKNNFEEIDSCCQKELMESRRTEEILDALRMNDRIAKAEFCRRNVISLSMPQKFSEPVFAMPFNNTKNETERCSEAEPYQNESIDGSLNSSSSESSEFDYLLDSFQPNQKEIHPKNDIRNIPVDQSKYREMLLKHGFTFYIDVIPDDVESLVEQYPFVLVHFSPEKSALSTSLDIFLNCKAAEYLGTRFIRVSASSSSALSFCGLRDGFVSGLASFRDGVCVSRSHGLRQFGVNTVDSNAVKQWLEYSNILKIDPLPSTFFSNFRSDQLKLDSSDDEEELEISRRYNCGRNGCNKPFVHEHVDTSLSKKVKIIAPGLGNSRESILS